MCPAHGLATLVRVAPVRWQSRNKKLQHDEDHCQASYLRALQQLLFPYYSHGSNLDTRLASEGLYLASGEAVQRESVKCEIEHVIDHDAATAKSEDTHSVEKAKRGVGGRACATVSKHFPFENHPEHASPWVYLPMLTQDRGLFVFWEEEMQNDWNIRLCDLLLHLEYYLHALLTRWNQGYLLPDVLLLLPYQYPRSWRDKIQLIVAVVAERVDSEVDTGLVTVHA